MKRLLYVHHGGALGGAPTSLSLVLEKLDRRKYAAKIVLLLDGPAKNLFQNTGIEVEVDQSLKAVHGSTVSRKWSRRIFVNNFIRAPFSYWATKKLIKKMKPEVVHLNSTALCIVAWAVKSVDKRIKVICHVREPLRRSLAGCMIRFFCRKFVDYFIAIDTHSAETIRAKNIQVIYNPVDLSKFHPFVKPSLERQALNISTKSIVFLFLARVAAGNGVLELLELADRQQYKNDNFIFLISGLNNDDPDNYARRVKAQAKALTNVRLLSFSSNPVDLIKCCDVMIVPFTEPHFARAGVEAASMGIPVVGANIGGVKECVQHNVTGFLYNSIDELEYYTALLGNNAELREALGTNAVSFAKENFDVNESARKVFNVYENLLNQNEIFERTV